MVSPLLIDVRTAEEYAEGHAPGATLLPLVALVCGNLGVLAETEKDAPIEVYCHSGARAEQARQILTDLGYSQVVNRGGLSDVLGVGVQADE